MQTIDQIQMCRANNVQLEGVHFDCTDMGIIHGWNAVKMFVFFSEKIFLKRLLFLSYNSEVFINFLLFFYIDFFFTAKKENKKGAGSGLSLDLQNIAFNSILKEIVDHTPTDILYCEKLH